MPIKPKQRELRDKNIVDPKDFDQEYDSLKSTINGGLDKQNLPLSGIDADSFQDRTFCSYYRRYMKMDENVVVTFSDRSGNYYDEMPAQTYDSYAGGWYESQNKLLIPKMKEGMCHIEFNATYFMNFINLCGQATSTGTPAADVDTNAYAYFQMQLRHNGNVIAETAKMSRNLQTFHICSSIPVASGISEISVAWRFNGRRQDTTNFPLDCGMMYWTGGSLLAINYYR